MKKISRTMIVFILGILVAFTIDVAAEAVISSGSVSYSNAATSETTVSGALDELFSAVDINSKIGTTDISAIGDGTLTSAISEVNNNLDSLIICKAYTISALEVSANTTLLQKAISSIAIDGYLPVSAIVVSSSIPQGTTYMHTSIKLFGSELWMQLINTSTVSIKSDYNVRVCYIKS